ncbi:MAG TPA: hypothetical protein VNT75_19925 [Symbiobacteriaceae bacterium]|nr:hypothetical protein [Symbiobacteriaceae bacterium]
MSGLTKIVLAVVLPVALYFSTITLPLNDSSWLGFWNSALWIANGLYFVIYLPVKGLNRRNWVAMVLLALLAVAVFTTAFQAARNDRTERYKQQTTGQGG